MAEEHSVAGTGGMMTTEEAGTAMKTDTTDEMTGPGVPEMITRDDYRRDDRGPLKDPN